MYTLFLNEHRKDSHFKQWEILDRSGNIRAVVLADPDDGGAFTVNFIEDTPTGCKNILNFIEEAEKAGGFKL